jgi:hypothetical protein
MGWIGDWMEKKYVEAYTKNRTKKPGKLVWKSYVFAFSNYTSQTLLAAKFASNPPTASDLDKIVKAQGKLRDAATRALRDNFTPSDICDAITNSLATHLDHAGETALGVESIKNVIQLVRTGSLLL